MRTAVAKRSAIIVCLLSTLVVAGCSRVFAEDREDTTVAAIDVADTVAWRSADAPPPDQAVAPAASADDEEQVADAEKTVDEELELELDERPTSFPDPWEPLNRRTLGLNQTMDRWVVSPVTRAYGYVVPDRAKESVRDFFSNLESPAIFVNDVLQGEMSAAANTFARFSVNTIFGLAGLFDPATAIGLEKHDADFGQTLAKSGVGSGPFLIVPLLGPTTVRDGIGSLVDVALQPTIYLLGPAPIVVAGVQEGTSGLTLREQYGEDLERLEQGSLDYYAALRSAYYQERMADLVPPLPTVGEAVAAASPPVLEPTPAAAPGAGVAIAPPPPGAEPPT